MKKKCLKKNRSQEKPGERKSKTCKKPWIFHFWKSFFAFFFEQSFFNILFSLFCDCLKVIRFRQVFMTFSLFFGRKCCKTQETHEEIDENDAPLPHPRYLCGRSCKGATTTKTRDLSFHFTSFYLFHFISSHFIAFDSLIHWFIHSFIHSFVRSFVHSFIHSFIQSFIHSFIHSSIHSFIHSLTHSFIHSFLSFISFHFISFHFISFHFISFHSIHSFIHSFIHSIIHFMGVPSRLLWALGCGAPSRLSRKGTLARRMTSSFFTLYFCVSKVYFCLLKAKQFFVLRNLVTKNMAMEKL